MSKKSSSLYFVVSLASLTLAVLCIVGIIILPVLYVKLTDRFKYGIAIDAGSTHTDMIFYRWDIPKYMDTGEVEEIHFCESSESLRSYTSNPDKAGSLFDDCIKESRENEYVPESLWDSTQMFMGATSGMRLVNRSNRSISEQIFVSANMTLDDSGYDFVSGRIITGQEEAVGGWVSGNYLTNNLRESNRPLVGSLELGSAAAQIAFQSPSGGSPEYETTVTLFEEDYRLYARSYLCYGQDQAYAILLAYLINSTRNTTGEIENPCLLRGANMTYEEDDIYTPCVTSSYSSQDEAESYTFIGTGDQTECNDTVYKLFDLTKCSDPTVCIDSTYFWPPVDNSGTYVGVAAFYYVADFFNNSNVELNNFTDYIATKEEFCDLTNSTAFSMYPGDRFLQRHCFDGAYGLFLLQSGFGFNDTNSGWTLKFVRKINEMTVSWAMGYLINQTTVISNNPHEVQRPFSTAGLAVGLVVLILFCVVFVIVSILTCLMGCREYKHTSE